MYVSQGSLSVEAASTLLETPGETTLVSEFLGTMDVRNYGDLFEGGWSKLVLEGRDPDNSCFWNSWICLAAARLQ